jgi:hypothetical protein
VHEALAKANFERDAAFLTPRFLESRDWTVNELQFPIMDVTFNGSKPIRVRLQCDNWNEEQPLETLLKPDGTDWNGPTTTPDSIFNAGNGRAFICMRGFRGYHLYGNHTSDLWANHKDQDGNNLPGLLDQLSAAWRRMMGS